MTDAIIAHSLPERQSLFRRAKWLRRDAIVAVCLSLMLLSGMYLAKWDRFAWLSHTTLFPVYLPFYVGVLLVYPAWLARKRTRGPAFYWPQIGSLVKEFVLAVLMTACLWVIAALVALVFGLTSKAASPNPDSWGELAYRTDTRNAMVLAILAISIGPVVEEVFFRGFLYNALRCVCPAMIAACLQAALFGMAHAYHPSAAIVTSCIGLILAGVYEWRKTILAPMFVHGLCNAAGAVVLVASIAASANAPMLGVQGSRDNSGQVVVRQVAPGSPAEIADIRFGDVILSYNNVPVNDFVQLIQLVRAGRIGDIVRIELLRDGARLEKQAQLRSAKSTVSGPTPPAR